MAVASLAGCSSQTGGGPVESQPDAGAEAGTDAGAEAGAEAAWPWMGDCWDEGPSCQEELARTPEGKGLPPPPSPQAVAPDGPPVTFVVRRVFLGETGRDGSANEDAWKTYGFDLDGYTSDVTYAGHCKAAPGGKKADIRVDGIDGIDNTFGKNIIAILQTFTQSPSQSTTESIAKGETSIALQIASLGPGMDQTGLQVTVSAVRGAMGKDGVLEAPPQGSWAEHAFRPIETAPSATFTEAYLTGDTLVLGPPADLPITLVLSGARLDLPLRRAQLTAKLSADHTRIVEGNLGGLVRRDELLAVFSAVAPSLSTSLCDSASLEGINGQIAAASDILSNGTLDPTKVCDALSIGIGFTADAAKLGEPASLPAKGDPCAGDGG